MGNVLQAGKRPVLVVKRNHQPTVSGDPSAMHTDALAGEIRVVWVRGLGRLPDGLDGVRCNLVLAL